MIAHGMPTASENAPLPPIIVTSADVHDATLVDLTVDPEPMPAPKVRLTLRDRLAVVSVNDCDDFFDIDAAWLRGGEVQYANDEAEQAMNDLAMDLWSAWSAAAYSREVCDTALHEVTSARQKGKGSHPREETISEDDFEQKYRPLENAHGDNTWTFPEVKGQPVEHVWTIVDGTDDGDLYALPGFHVVNAVSYVVTEVPWPSETADAVWAHFEHDSDGGEVACECSPPDLFDRHGHACPRYDEPA